MDKTDEIVGINPKRKQNKIIRNKGRKNLKIQ
jgi:hypothetical protein